MPKPLVLVPGACLGGWAWQAVAPRLRAAGRDVHPVTLTGLGERVHLASPEVDLETHIADVLNLLDYEDLHDAVLLGHSYSGVVVAGVADRRPERLNAVVYLDTGPLPDGMAITDVQPPELRDRQRREAEEFDGWRWPVPSRDAIAAGTFGSGAGLDDRALELIAERGTPHPYVTLASKLRLTHPRPPGVRRVAIFGSDGGLSIAMLRDLIDQRDPRAMLFADPDWELHELHTGHWPMFSQPAELAELLATIAA
jgi:pimeloyl-ACP methyl ester carboxylesterase